MANLDYNLLVAVRAVLIGDATLIALVPADQILPQEGVYPAEYPAITLSLMGNRGGANVPDSLVGVFHIRMYHQGSKPFYNLDQIHSRVKVLLDQTPIAESGVSDANVRVHRFFESFCSTMIVEDEAIVPEVRSLNSNYSFLATDET